MLTETLATANALGFSDTQIYAALVRQAELYCFYTFVELVVISIITLSLVFFAKTSKSVFIVVQLYLIYALFWVIFILPDVVTAQYNPIYFALQQLLQK